MDVAQHLMLCGAWGGWRGAGAWGLFFVLAEQYRGSVFQRVASEWVGARVRR